jgi:tetratricopeptide (TPR) repeat protein
MRLKVALVSSIIAITLAGCGRTAGSYVSKGNKYFAEKKYDDAMLEYRKAIQLDRKNSQAYYRMGIVQAQLGELPQAYDSLTLATQFNPADRAAAVALGDLAWSIYTADDRPAPRLYNDLSKISERLLSGNARDFDGLRFQADIAVADKRIDDAIALLQQANSIRPLFGDVVMPLAQLVLQRGDVATGEKLLRQLISANPRYGSAYNALYALYAREKHFVEAEALLRQRIEKNPGDTDAVIQLAEYYSSQGNEAAMNGVLRGLIDQRSQYRDAREALGDFYARHKQPNQAIQQFQQAIQENPKSEIQYRKKIASILFSEGKFQDVEKCLQEILKKDPENFEALRLEASLHLSSRKPADIRAAVDVYPKLIARRPDDSQLHFDYAMALLASGDSKTARSELMASIQRQPAAIAPRLALAELAFREKNYSDAIENANEVLARDSQQTLARLLVAMSKSGLGLYDDARRDLTRLVREQPNNPGPELELGLLDVIQKRYAEANAIFEKYYRSNQVDPRRRGIEGMVRSDVAQGEMDKAVLLLNEEVRKAPNATQMRWMLGTIATTAGKYDLAAAQYQALAAQAPNSSDIHLRWAEVLHDKGDFEGAIEHYRKAAALTPKNAMPAALLARELESAGHRQEAIAAYRQVLQLDPNNIFVLNNLAFLLADSGQDLEEALQMAQNARRLANNNIAVADTLGWVYLKKGLTSSALKVFETLVHEDPKNATYHYHFGVTLLASGEKAKARHELQAALGDRPSQFDEPKIRELLRKIG